MKKLLAAVLCVMMVAVTSAPASASTSVGPQSEFTQDEMAVHEVSQTSRVVQVSPTVTEEYITRTFSNGNQVTDVLRVERSVTRAGLERITPFYKHIVTDEVGAEAGYVTIRSAFTYDGKKATCTSKYYESHLNNKKFRNQSLTLKNGVTSGRKVQIDYTGSVVDGIMTKYIIVWLSVDSKGEIRHDGYQRV